MKNVFKVIILTAMLVLSNLPVSSQINELKQSIAESNRELPMKMNAAMTLESVKYEAGYVKYTVTMNCSPGDFNKLFKNRKREELVNLESFVLDKDSEEMVSLMIKTNTGLKYVYKCVQSDDEVEAGYGADEIEKCKQKGATDPYLLLSGMEYIQWFVGWHNEINKNIDQTGLICDGEKYVKDNAFVYTVLVPQKGIYKELDFNAVKTNRMAGLLSTNQGKKLLSEMVKLNMSMVFLIKDMHSDKSHQIKCDSNMLKDYVN